MESLFTDEGPFESLPDAGRKLLAERSKLQKFTDKQTIHLSAEPAKGIYGIVKGCVRISKSDAQGQYILVREIQKNNWFGFIGYFGTGYRPQEAAAKGLTELLFVSGAVLDKLLLEYPQIYRQILAIMAEYTTSFFASYESAVNLTLKARTANMLLKMQEWQKSHELNMTQQDLASFLGVTREAIGVHLSSLKADGIIDLAYRRIIILQPDTLHLYADEK